MSDATSSTHLWVNRNNLSESRTLETPLAELAEGEVRLRVTKFAFTANNITYAVAGDMLRYWAFFPADDGWGRVPVWAIGEVTESRHVEVASGERYYGYFPMSTHLTVAPGNLSPVGFVDMSAHRQELPPTYNQYSRMTPELGFDPNEDDAIMVFRPLFMTAYLLADMIEDEGDYGAAAVILTSASSKTSFGLAHLLSQRDEPRPKVIGLTSGGNVDFVKELGAYDTVLTYDDVEQIDQDSVLVDMAGNAEVIASVHNHLKDRLKYSCMVGITHWQSMGPPGDLPGPQPTMFFAPDRVQKRAKDWGGGEFQRRFAEAWRDFMPLVNEHVTFAHGQGAEAVQNAYSAALAGKQSPNVASILSM